MIGSQAIAYEAVMVNVTYQVKLPSYLAEGSTGLSCVQLAVLCTECAPRNVSALKSAAVVPLCGSLLPCNPGQRPVKGRWMRVAQNETPVAVVYASDD
eukprot:356376-Chlamydomonas_euryale.AAC.8